MNKIQVIELVKESKLNKYEKLLLLDFIASEPESSIPFILDEFGLRNVVSTLKAIKSKAKKTYYDPEFRTNLFKAGTRNIAGGDLGGAIGDIVAPPAYAYAKKKGIVK